jgi:trimeric autotransporter adhesin
MKQKITFLMVLFIVSFGFAQSKTAKGQKTAASITFTGFSTGNWGAAGNWSTASVPTSADDVIIPNGKIVNLNSTTAFALSLNINSGGTLQIANGKSLKVTNALTNNGTLTITSDASLSPSLIVGSFSGSSITYQRYLTGGSTWHLISSPVTASQTIAAFIASFGGSMTQSGVDYSLAPYDNTFPAGGNTWVHYTTGAGTNLPPASSFVDGKGYEILMNGDGTVDFTGNILTTGKDITLTENTTGWNLIGNPYTSYLAMNSNANATNFLGTNSASLDPSFVSIYVWNPTNSSYDIYNQASAARTLAPGQGFFVKSKAGGGVLATFTTGMQLNSGNAFQKTASNIPTISLSVDNNSGIVSSTQIKYMSGTTLGLDPGYDAGRFGAVGTGFNVYTHLVQDNGVAFALQVVPETGYDTTVIPIGLDASAGTQITFKANATDLPVGKKVFLEDKLLSTVTEINNSDKFYTVTLSADLSGIGRFYMHTLDNASTLAIDDFTASKYLLIASPETQNIRLYGTVAEKGALAIYDSLGRMIYRTSLQTGTEQDIKVPKMSAGVYFVKISVDKKPFSKKIVWY